MNAVVATVIITLKQLVMSKFYLLLGVVQPLLYLVVTAALSRGAAPVAASAISGCAVLGMWSLILYGAGRALLRERSVGTAQFLLVTPHGLLRPVLGICIGAAMLGFMPTLTALAGGIAAGFRIDVTSVLLFVALVPVVMLGIVGQGLLLSALFVLSRQANALSNSLEYPVWIACGLLVPLADRPWWVAGIGAVLTPTYAGQVFRSALEGQGVAWTALSIMLALSAAQLLLAIPLFRLIEKRIRIKGDLTFA